jgi:hypothetical protein
MENRRHLHELVDNLPDSHVQKVEKLLEALTESPPERAIRLAPADDEPVTAFEGDAIRDSEADSRAPALLEELLAEFRIK